MKLNIGDKAPDFALPDQDGILHKLSDYQGRKLVIYFYPKDDTPGCTAQACSFRDSYEDFVQAGAEVIGVSSDETSSHESFATKHRLPFTLISDTDGSLRKRYGVPRSFLGLLPGRVTYVIDREGIVQHVFDSQRAARHIPEAMEVIKRLSAT